MNQLPIKPNPQPQLATLCCTVIASQGLLKRVQPNRQSALINPPLSYGEHVCFIGIVTTGEPVNGNPRWGHYKSGAEEFYFWMGGTDWG